MVDNFDEGTEMAQVMSDLIPYLRINSIYRDDAFASSIKHTRKSLEKQGKSLDDLVTAYVKNGTLIENNRAVADFLRDFETVLRKNKANEKLRLF